MSQHVACLEKNPSTDELHERANWNKRSVIFEFDNFI